MRIPALMALLTLASGCDAPRTLVIDVRTDLVPGAELDALSAVLADGSDSGRVQVDVTTDWLSGGRVAELSVPRGTRTVIVTAFDRDGRELVERSVRVRVDVDTAVTVLVTRDCRGVVCDVPAASVCWAGSCVSETCTDEMFESCGDPECTDNSDCPTAGPCGNARCELGACVYETVSTCGASEYCDPEFGCRTTGNNGTNEGLIAHYRFDDDPSDGVLDSSGSERHASCIECPELTSGGPRGSYYLSTGAAQIARVPNDAVLESLTELTAAGWVRLDDGATSSRSLFGKPWGSGVGNSWELNFVDDSAGFTTRLATGGEALRPIDPLPRNVWIHVAATFDGATQTLYVDGVPVSSLTSTPLVFDDTAVALMADINDGVVSSLLFGGADDLRLYDRALTEAEIRELATP